MLPMNLSTFPYELKGIIQSIFEWLPVEFLKLGHDRQHFFDNYLTNARVNTSVIWNFATLDYTVQMTF